MSSNYRGKTQKDEVRDEQGRRRFHGAFTGGFSAGYFNSVGTEEGWQPSTFKSSRASRAEGQQQRPEDFMDEEDGLLGRELEAQLPYDTLGEASKQLQRKQAEKEAVGSAIPGIVVDELLAPTDVAVGKKLLQMMGWKEGLGVGSRQHRRPKKKNGKKEEEEEEEEEDDFDATALLPDHLRQDASLVQQGKLTFARPNLGVTVLPTPKNDQFGLGFDPDKDAPEFAALRRAGGGGDGDDHRGVYRMADVLGKSTSSKAGRRNAMGFALDEDEDDVYDALPDLGGGGGGGGEKSRYHMTLGGPDEDEDEDERMGRGPKVMSGAAQRMALEEWIGDAGKRDVAAAAAAPTRCPTDSRLVPDGFVLGLEQMAFKQVFWPPPTPPRGFQPFHRFEEAKGEDSVDHGAAVRGHREANQGRLQASSRGTLLGEAPARAPVGEGGKEATSIFDLMSEADRQRIQGFKDRVQQQQQQAPLPPPKDETQALPPPPPPAPHQPVFQGMQGALAKRFSVAERPTTAGPTLKEGLIEGGKGAGAPTIPPPAPKPKELEQPRRSEGLWYPCSLLCKRFNVPVPMHAKVTPGSITQQQVLQKAAFGGGGGGGGGRGGGEQQKQQQQGKQPPTSLLSNKFDQEMEALLPGGGKLALDPTTIVEEVQEEEEELGGDDGEEKEAVLPAFEEKPRPSKDFFKAIFEAAEESSSCEEESDEDGEEKVEEKEKIPPPATQPKRESPAAEAKLAGDAPTPPRVNSPPRDYFLQPAQAVEGETMEALLAKGPMLLNKKKRKAAKEEVDDLDAEEEEEEEGLVFGAAVLKKKKKPFVQKPKTTAVKQEGGEEGRGGGETPPPRIEKEGGATRREVPPTPPHMEEVAAALEASHMAIQPKEEEGGRGKSSDDSSSGSSSSEDDEDMGPTPMQKLPHHTTTTSSSVASRRESDRKRHRKEKKKRRTSGEKDRKKHKRKHKSSSSSSKDRKKSSKSSRR